MTYYAILSVKYNMVEKTRKRNFCPENSNGETYGNPGEKFRFRYRPAGGEYGGLASAIRIDKPSFVDWVVDFIRSDETERTQRVSLADDPLTIEYYKTTDEGEPVVAMVIKQADTVLDAFVLIFSEVEEATKRIYHRVSSNLGGPGFVVNVLAYPAWDMRIIKSGRKTESIDPTVALAVDKLIREIFSGN